MARRQDDPALVARCVAGEPGAWKEFVDRFAGLARAIARRYLALHGQSGDDALLDDLVQDVFLAFTQRDYRLLKDYDPAYAFTTYLGVVTRTQVHRELRRRKHAAAPAEELGAAADPAAGAPERAALAEEGEIVMRALDGLDPQEAELLRLRFLRGFDYKRIAAATGIAEASVGQLLFRAKQALLRRMKRP